MTIWILTLVLLASLAALGYRQGAIRVTFSLLGILLGALVAVPLGHLLSPLLAKIGLKNPALLWTLPPFIVFVVLLTLFKIGGAMTHKKVEMFYKYKAGNLRQTLWERLDRRLGLCLGLVNGTVYLILISFMIYALSYWTVQMAAQGSDPKLVKIFDQLGRDLESTGMTKVARAIDRLPDAYYETADIVGLIYQNQPLHARLSRYPAFLSLMERPEFQAVAADTALAASLQSRASIKEIIDNPSVQVILKNPDTLNVISNAFVPNLQDLRVFLETGKSPEFDGEKILGRWDFNVNSVIAAFRRAKPNITPSQMQALRQGLGSTFSKTTLIAAPDHQAFLKSFPSLQQSVPRNVAGRNNPPPAAPPQNLQGQWKNSDGKYELAFTIDGKSQSWNAVIENDRLTINVPGFNLVFDRAD